MLWLKGQLFLKQENKWTKTIPNSASLASTFPLRVGKAIVAYKDNLHGMFIFDTVFHKWQFWPFHPHPSIVSTNIAADFRNLMPFS